MFGPLEVVGLAHVENMTHGLNLDFDPHPFMGHEPNKIRRLLKEILLILFNETLAQNIDSV